MTFDMCYKIGYNTKVLISTETTIIFHFPLSALLIRI